MKANFDELSSNERTGILVASDAKYNEIINQIDPIKAVLLAGGAFHFPYAAGVAATVTALFDHSGSRSDERETRTGTGPEGTYFATTFAAMNDRTKKKNTDLRSRLQRLVTKGDVPLPHLSPSEARRRFKFDLGGPEDGGVYVLNPCVTDHYLPPAVANERLAQEKLGAFLQIASALGAKKVEVTSGESLARGGKAGAAVPLPDCAGQVGLSVSFKSDTSFDRQVSAKFGSPSSPPHVPEGLEGWLIMEPNLRAMVKMRMQNSLTEFGVNLEFGNTIDVGAEITAKFAKLGLKVGGSFREVKASRWSFAVEFWPKP